MIPKTLNEEFSHLVLGKISYHIGHEKLLRETLNAIKMYPFYIPKFLLRYLVVNSKKESRKSYFLRNLRNKLSTNQIIWEIKNSKIEGMLNEFNTAIIDQHNNAIDKMCIKCGEICYSKTCIRCS